MFQLFIFNPYNMVNNEQLVNILYNIFETKNDLSKSNTPI